MSQSYCNNCGKHGHSFNNCKVPITSFGIIVFRKTPEGKYEYLMIRRKDTLGYVDFMRGKYSIYNKDYIMNMIKQMTNDEKENILNVPFQILWYNLWGESATNEAYRSEEMVSQDKLAALRQGINVSSKKEDMQYYLPSFLEDELSVPSNEPHSFSLQSMIDESNQGATWTEPEWGFPKGRRNYQEKDYDCAVREFCEETGYHHTDLIPLINVFPFEEIFTGSNYKSYKHKYYLTYMKYENSVRSHIIQPSEISCAKWKSYEECMESIRYYNLEKKQILTQIHQMLETMPLFLE
jgi:8-oxo-dGTP pyrophosphatase MutT (NUDIX family)